MASGNSALIEQGTEYIGDTGETVVAVAGEGNGTGKGKTLVTGKKQEEKMKKLTLLIEKKINTEDLIYEVEKNPCIWDSRVEGYSNKIDKLNAWNDILVYFINDFESKPIDEKNILVTIVQKKWKGIRTCYARELLKKKTVQSGSGASNRKQYVYFDQLRFLETISKKTTNSMEVEEGEDVNDVEEDVDRDDPQSPGNTASFDNTIRPKTTRKRGSRNSDDELIVTLKKKAAQDEKEEKNNKDEDRLFLLSLLSEMKKKRSDSQLDVDEPDETEMQRIVDTVEPLSPATSVTGNVTRIPREKPETITKQNHPYVRPLSKKVAEQRLIKIETAFGELKAIINQVFSHGTSSVQTNCEFDMFSKLVSTQLKKLPEVEALAAMQEIQSCLFRRRMACANRSSNI